MDAGSYHSFAANVVRFQMDALPYKSRKLNTNLGVAQGGKIVVAASLHRRLIKTGAKVVEHGR
jgi:hypothetical protein